MPVPEGGGTYMIFVTFSLFIEPTFISATIGLGFTSAVMRKVIGASDLTGASFITGSDFFSRFWDLRKGISWSRRHQLWRKCNSGGYKGIRIIVQGAYNSWRAHIENELLRSGKVQGRCCEEERRSPQKSPLVCFGHVFPGMPLRHARSMLGFTASISE